MSGSQLTDDQGEPRSGESAATEANFHYWGALTVLGSSPGVRRTGGGWDHAWLGYPRPPRRCPGCLLQRELTIRVKSCGWR